MYSKYQEANDKLENEPNSTVLSQVLIDYSPGVVLRDSAIETFFSHKHVAMLISPEGFVKIGRSLHYFSDDYQIIIVDGSKEKMLLALQRPITDTLSGIFVIPFWIESPGVRNNCPLQAECETKVGNKRVKGLWRFGYFLSPIFENGQYTRWESGISYYCELKSQKRTVFWFENNQDDVSWSSDYSLFTTIGSSIDNIIRTGQGNLTYSDDVIGPFNTPYSQAPPQAPFIDLQYNLRSIENTSEGFSCTNDCL